MSEIRPEEVLTSVWWDIETCPVPDRYDAGGVGRSIKTVLKNGGCLGPIIVTAIGNLNLIPHNVLQKLSSTGVALKYVSCGIKDISNDIYRWEDSHSPPANKVVISGEDLPETFIMIPQRQRGYTTFRACPFPPKFPARWLWPEDLLEDATGSGGSSADNEQKKLRETCYRWGEYAFSCTLCGVACHSFEIFSMHLQSKQHELFDISVNTVGEASKNAYYMALSASKFRPSLLSPDLKLFVGNLSFNVDRAQLTQLFESVGNVEMVEVIYDKVTGRSRGFGFVTMSTAAEVEAAVQQFNGHEFEGRPLRVNAGPPPPKREESVSRGPRSGGYGSERGGGYGGSQRSSYGSGSGSGSGNRLYVGNLSWGVDDMALESLFNEQGKVVEARVIYERDSGRSKGFGFVTLSSSQEVQKAIKSLNGADLDGRQIRVSKAEARPPRGQF
ncbi:unnamed protein product [Arabidopsis arenosa]|uniref:Meiosis regulator and mRNA stability factor 1 n=1 Tax=Arabidopsis arenosa TaxID=38785 RepID=A0A8S2AMJ8_ARAAE|nr:unnamed protein product [Arabidopsis arenosa]